MKQDLHGNIHADIQAGRQTEIPTFM